MSLHDPVLDFFALVLHYLHRSTLSSLRARLEFRPHIPPVPRRSRFKHRSHPVWRRERLVVWIAGSPLEDVRWQDWLND
jgi:hypothetical protein